MFECSAPHHYHSDRSGRSETDPTTTLFVSFLLHFTLFSQTARHARSRTSAASMQPPNPLVKTGLPNQLERQPHPERLCESNPSGGAEMCGLLSSNEAMRLPRELCFSHPPLVQIIVSNCQDVTKTLKCD